MAVTLKTGWMKRTTDGGSERVYAQSHAKCCCFGDPRQGVTVQDKMDTLEHTVQECFQSVSDGKKLLASTLTEGGVETAGSASFEEINTNIKAYGAKRYNAGAANAQVEVTSAGTVKANEDGSGKVDTFILSPGTYLYSVNAVNGYNGELPAEPVIGVSVSAGTVHKIDEAVSSSGKRFYSSIVSKTATYLLGLPAGGEVITLFPNCMNTDLNGNAINGCVVRIG